MIMELAPCNDEARIAMPMYEFQCTQCEERFEDLVRNVAMKLRADERIIWFRVHALNHESIHNHDAFAEIEWIRPGTEG